MIREELIEREKQMQGGDIEPLDYAELAGDCKILIYRVRYDSVAVKGLANVLVCIRFAVYTPEGGGTGGIVSSTWEEPGS